MVVFINKGRQDGVSPGDIFEMRRRPGRTSDGLIRVNELMATMQIVHVRDHTATGVLLTVVICTPTDLHAGLIEAAALRSLSFSSIVSPLPLCPHPGFPASTPVLYCGAFSCRRTPLTCGEMEMRRREA